MVDVFVGVYVGVKKAVEVEIFVCVAVCVKAKGGKLGTPTILLHAPGKMPMDRTLKIRNRFKGL